MKLPNRKNPQQSLAQKPLMETPRTWDLAVCFAQQRPQRRGKARVAREARAARERERWLSLLSTEQPTSLSLQLARIAKSNPLLAKNYSTSRFKADQLKAMNWTQINSVELNFGNIIMLTLVN